MSSSNSNLRLYKKGTVLKTLKKINLYKDYVTNTYVEIPKGALIIFLDYVRREETRSTVRRYYYQDMLLTDDSTTRYRAHKCFKEVKT